MLRTLDPIIDEVQSPKDLYEISESFYMNDLSPMFLAGSKTVSQTSQRLEEDMSKCKQLIESLCDNQIKTKQNLEDIMQSIQSQDFSKGMGFFAAKNLIFAQYLMLLKLYELFKINGKSFTSGNALELYKRLAYLKTLLLKLQPVEKKLEYQKNKIIQHFGKVLVAKQNKKQLSESDQLSAQNQAEQNIQDQHFKQQLNQNKDDEMENNQEQDEMAFKPRPSALIKIKKQREVKLGENDKYEPPKLSSHLSKQDKFKARQQRQKDIRKIRLIRRLQSDLIEDNTVEQKFLGEEVNERFKKKFQQKVNYEEDAFIRLPDSKRDKFYIKQMIRNSMRKSQLDEDFKQVQMVRKLFDQENQMQDKFLSKKTKSENAKHPFRNDQQAQKGSKTKKISKN